MDRGRFQTYPAVPHDADLVGRLLFDFNQEFDGRGPDAQDLGARFRGLLTRDDVIVILSGDATAPSGFAFVTLRPTPYYDGPLAQLEELYVRPGDRDRGIGTALLEHAFKQVRSRGAQEMHINVDEIDTDARRFYERHGFVNVESGAECRMLCYVQEFPSG